MTYQEFQRRNSDPFEPNVENVRVNRNGSYKIKFQPGQLIKAVKLVLHPFGDEIVKGFYEVAKRARETNSALLLHYPASLVSHEGGHANRFASVIGLVMPRCGQVTGDVILSKTKGECEVETEKAEAEICSTVDALIGENK